jgi:hypothetical protein
MTKKETTPFDTKCEILGDLWMKYRFEKQFSDFVAYNDIGLPLGFLVSEDLVTPAPMAKGMIEETFELLLASLNVSDKGYESLDDLLFAAPEDDDLGAPGAQNE